MAIYSIFRRYSTTSIHFSKVSKTSQKQNTFEMIIRIHDPNFILRQKKKLSTKTKAVMNIR
ncbi:hypothetical protein ACTXT7_002518 [Hymenolepis weldensis]